MPASLPIRHSAAPASRGHVRLVVDADRQQRQLSPERKRRDRSSLGRPRAGRSWRAPARGRPLPHSGSPRPGIAAVPRHSVRLRGHSFPVPAPHGDRADRRVRRAALRRARCTRASTCTAPCGAPARGAPRRRGDRRALGTTPRLDGHFIEVDGRSAPGSTSSTRTWPPGRALDVATGSGPGRRLGADRLTGNAAEHALPPPHRDQRRRAGCSTRSPSCKRWDRYS